jgi:hypothetical protein
MAPASTREEVVDKAFFDRWMPASGILFVVLVIVGFLVIGTFPAVDDPAEEFAAFYVDDRGRIIAGALILAAALYFFIWFAAALAARIRDLGEPRPAAAVVAGGIGFVALALAATGMLAALAHTTAEEVIDPALIKGLDALVSGVDILSVVPLAALVFAFGVAALRTGMVPSWFGLTSLAVSLIVLLSATTWARDGFWGPYGGYFMIALIVFLAWVVVASALLIARPPAASDQPITSVPQASPPPPPR